MIRSAVLSSVVLLLLLLEVVEVSVSAGLSEDDKLSRDDGDGDARCGFLDGEDIDVDRW